MFLTKEEEGMLKGDYGPGIKRSMELLVKLGEAFEAERMVMAQSAHYSARTSALLSNRPKLQKLLKSR